MFLLQDGKTSYAGFKLGFVSYVYRVGNYELTESHENPGQHDGCDKTSKSRESIGLCSFHRDLWGDVDFLTVFLGRGEWEDKKAVMNHIQWAREYLKCDYQGSANSSW